MIVVFVDVGIVSLMSTCFVTFCNFRRSFGKPSGVASVLGSCLLKPKKSEMLLRRSVVAIVKLVVSAGELVVQSDKGVSEPQWQI